MKSYCEIKNSCDRPLFSILFLDWKQLTNSMGFWECFGQSKHAFFGINKLFYPTLSASYSHFFQRGHLTCNYVVLVTV